MSSNPVRKSKRVADIKEAKEDPETLIKKMKVSEELMKKKNEMLYKKLESSKKALSVANLNSKMSLEEEREKTNNLSFKFSILEMKYEIVGEKMKDQSEKLKNQDEKIHELESKLDECKEHENMEETINKERQKTKNYRQRLMKQMKKIQNEKEEKNQGSLPWKTCEICAFAYGEDEKRVPRVLGCGHTVCTECAENLVNNNSIRCPFDRQFLRLGAQGIDELPKNFIVLNM